MPGLSGCGRRVDAGPVEATPASAVAGANGQPNGQERSTLDDQQVPAFSQDHRSSHLDLAGPMDPNGLRRLTRLVRTGGGGSSRWRDSTTTHTSSTNTNSW
jgi:hypothetical protein